MIFIEMVWDLYPKGAAWVREPGVIDELNASISSELVIVDSRTSKLINEADPRTVSEMLGDWERNYGLPDECTPIGSTVERRRNSLVAKINFLGDMRPKAYIAVANELNYDVDLVEWRPFVCGGSECGGTDMLGDEDGPFRHGIWIFTVFQSYFETGVSACAEIPWDHGENADELIAGQ